MAKKVERLVRYEYEVHDSEVEKVKVSKKCWKVSTRMMWQPLERKTGSKQLIARLMLGMVILHV